MSQPERLSKDRFVWGQGLGADLCAFTTTRFGGESDPPFYSLNLGEHVGDHPQAVQQNRQLLREWVCDDPLWLEQVHGNDIVDADLQVTGSSPPQADAAITVTPGRVLAVLTADCLPVVMTTSDAQVLCVAHAGWRGLLHGILPAAVKAMQEKCASPAEIKAWIGPCIGPKAFQTGPEVRTHFADQSEELGEFFQVDSSAQGKWLADLPGIATWQLLRAGATAVQWCGYCTVTDPEARFFSYRRDGRTGRMATVAWLEQR